MKMYLQIYKYTNMGVDALSLHFTGMPDLNTDGEYVYLYIYVYIYI
jgi:hypothetical protein